jgi:phosphopantothenoylcysteine decarboxylase
MNTQMYTHPITAHHLHLIKALLPYIELMNPIEKILACGDVGLGGMADWGNVVGRVVRKLNLRIRPESEEDEEEELSNGDEADEEDDEGGDEDEDIRVGGEEHEDEKRDNEVREQEEEEEERLEMSRLSGKV